MLVVVCLLSSLCGCPQTRRWRVQFASQPAPHVGSHLMTRRGCRCGRSCLHILLLVLRHFSCRTRPGLSLAACLWGSGLVLFHSNLHPLPTPVLFCFYSLSFGVVLRKTPLTHCSKRESCGYISQDSENLLAATGFGKSIGCNRIRKIDRLQGKNLSQQDKTFFIARIFLWKKSEKN